MHIGRQSVSVTDVKGFDYRASIPYESSNTMEENMGEGKALPGLLFRQLVSMGMAMPLRQWMQAARPWSYSVKMYLDDKDKLGNYESIFP